MLIVKFSSGRKWKSIGKRIVIDIKNKKDVKNYITYLIDYYNSRTDWYNRVEPDQIAFEWIYLDSSEYKRIQRKQMLASFKDTLPTDLDKIPGIKSIPYNIDYSKWGDSLSVVDNITTIIKNISISQNIKEIIISTISRFTKEVLIKYNFGQSVMFTDFIGKGFIKRTNNEAKKVFFGSTDGKPFFYFEECQSDDLMYKVNSSIEYLFNVCTLDLETYLDKKRT